MFRYFRERRRAKIRRRPFPDAWRKVIEEHLPIYHRLPHEAREELLGHLLVFLEEKAFEGCGGLDITDEIRVTIAAQACVLLLHRETDYYPRLRSILVYPDSYLAPSTEWNEDGTFTDEDEHRLGESWTTGSVILSWHATMGGAAGRHDGQNVVFHEFAHQLDQEDGLSDGAPVLGQQLAFTKRQSMYVSWARTMQHEFDQLQDHVERGRRTVLDEYGATDPAEFFAVATETFFEKPRLLSKRHPELYGQLSQYYCQDPANWTAAPGDDPDALPDESHDHE